MKAWCHASIGTACRTPEVATQWADHAYNAYLKRWQWRNQEEEDHKAIEVEPIVAFKKKGE